MRSVWMDRGGTFTDVVRVGDDGALAVEKVLSDQADLEELGGGALDVRRGTTVATNALLERKGAPVLLVTTAGFRDLLVIRDQTRPDLFALHVVRPPPLATEIVEVTGRIDAHGDEVVRHDWSKAPFELALARGIRSAAVVLVHGPLRPAIESQIAATLRDVGFAHVSIGHEVAPSRGFLARLETTLADAATTPLLSRARGLYMRSDGGLARPEEWRGRDALLSGPAGGVVAVAEIARRAALPRVIGLDMGGTSTDVCRIEGEPGRTDHLRIAGLELRVPAVELQTVAAGGGSILGALAGTYTVGPHSAGASPGPASYGRGGPAALTDVEVVLGRLPLFPSVCGPKRDGPLDVAAAQAAVAALDPSRPLEEVAMGYRVVAAETMARAVRRLAASLGVDPRAHGLVAFGGAGPAHACAVAERLGIERVVVPHLASVLSAVGIGSARRRAVGVAPIVGDPGAALERARAALPFVGTETAVIVLRHVGTATGLEVPFEGDRVEAFHVAHRARFGFARPELAVEEVEVRVTVEEDAPAGMPRPDRVDHEPTTTRAWFDGWREVAVHPLDTPRSIEGPALLVGNGTTVVVERGWITAPGDGFLSLRATKPFRPELGTAFHPVDTAVFATRVMAIAEQMGERLGRLARSVNIRERKDFSCAVFDRDGYLVANAPHVPVHLGAMGETVRRMIAAHPMARDQVWVTNDPYCGGSHLPDVTVVRPVHRGDERIGFVACRGHHADVGGITPGSMPPFATRLEEEGVRLLPQVLVDGDAFRRPDLGDSREPDVVVQDLMAQAAACTFGAERVARLEEEVGATTFRSQLGHLQGQARSAVEAVLAARQGVARADDDDDPPFSAAIDFDRRRVVLHGPAHLGNLNAPTAVARAALLYVLRCLVPDDLPLNEGALAALALEVEPGGLFDPSAPRAVAGGNVETSQRLVDLLLRATGALAASQGTMNNLTIGTATGAWYETIAGGMGAGPTFAGASGVQVHMTNTRATDVEELEARFPVRLELVRLRTGSGGAGLHRGGDGIVKQWLFLAPADVALLAGRRSGGAPGLAGGDPGQPGLDERDVGHGWEAAPSVWRAEAGHRLRICTPGGGGYGPSTSRPGR